MVTEHSLSYYAMQYYKLNLIS